MADRNLTSRQQAVLVALRARPDYWITEASSLAEATGLSARGVLIVLYHLSDAGLVYYDECGWHVTD
jgi:DNA-binding MarR family transcriptional regulator